MKYRNKILFIATLITTIIQYCSVIILVLILYLSSTNSGGSMPEVWRHNQQVDQSHLAQSLPVRFRDDVTRHEIQGFKCLNECKYYDVKCMVCHSVPLCNYPRSGCELLLRLITSYYWELLLRLITRSSYYVLPSLTRLVSTRDIVSHNNQKTFKYIKICM